MEKKKIVICGGHFSSSLALIEELVSRKKYEIYYIGRRHALEGDPALSIEEKTFRGGSIPFYSITTGRLERYLGMSQLLSLLKFPMGILQSIYLLLKIKPEVVVSFGGYVALSVCLAAWVLGIPVLAHEQTPILGLSNRIISYFAKILCLSWSQTKFVSKNVKTVLTGNPIRKSILNPRGPKYTHAGDEKLPLIYITGGSLGSNSLNDFVSKIILTLSKNFRILHQCGDSRSGADYKKLTSIKDSLPLKLKKNYQVIKYLEPEKVGSILAAASILIGRAGANTVAEVAVAQVPAIFIPLPWSAENEQDRNAEILARIEVAVILKQSDLTPDKLLSTINQMIDNLSFYKRNAVEVSKLYPRDAAQKIADLIA